jgi:3-phytase
VNRQDPARSAVLATDKKGSLLVYDLSGRELQSLPLGDVNNVDVRSDLGTGTAFTLGGRPISLVTAGNRSNESIVVYEIDPGTRQLRDVAAREITPGIEIYGSCMYRSARSGKFYVFITSKGGEVEQWELLDDGGEVDARLVRSIEVSETWTEGCVADDDLGFLYVSDEERGIWKYGAEPGDGNDRASVGSTSATGPLVADVEGLALASAPDGTGLLIASSQGNSGYVVYRREGDNAFVGTFRVVPSTGTRIIDGTEDTDGIDVSTANLGPAFPKGLFVAQDGTNDKGNQNFKLVPYQSIAALTGAG